MENKNLNVLKQVVEEGFGNADLYVIDQLINDNCIEHQFGMHGGKEGLKKAENKGAGHKKKARGCEPQTFCALRYSPQTLTRRRLLPLF